MNLKQHQGKLVIFIIGILGFSLLGANSFSSVFLSGSILIISPIVSRLNKIQVAFDSDTRKLHWRIKP